MNNEANELRKMEIVRERAERMIEQQSILDVVSSLLLRLESGYAFDVEGRVVPSEACATYDGIACRDATIRLQDERIAELRKSISEAEKHVRHALLSLEYISDEGHDNADCSDGPDGIADVPNRDMRYACWADEAIAELRRIVPKETK